jgi:signal transduction histidine kinase
MLSRLRRRWQIIPVWMKTAPIIVLVVVLALLHHLPAVHASSLAPIVHRLFFLPLFMASLLFGVKGGLLCAAVISLNLVPQLLGTPVAGMESRLDAALEIALYFVTAAITGGFVDRERREAERRKQAENLALLGQAAAAVAHELKNPLVAIGGFAQRIHRELEPDHPHKKKMGIIVDQVAHMEQLLREMLDYSRPLDLQLAPHPLNELVDEVLMLTKPLAEESGVRLVCDPDPELGFPVLDAPRVRQVLMNLVQNAVQASSRGNTVWAHTRLNEGEAVVEVADQGEGIPEEHRERLFFPFFTTKRGGTGLGLAISNKIARAHGGELELAKSDDLGSTFRLRLPLEGPARPGG